MKLRKIRVTSQNLLIPLNRIKYARLSSLGMNIFMELEDNHCTLFLPNDDNLLKQLKKAVPVKEKKS